MFITFEGIEGVGKTTQLTFVAEELKKAGIPFIKTREPGGTQVGEEIRDVLLAHRHEPFVPITELLLMFAARAQHVETVIVPALKEGKWVLCDRFSDATYAYQGGGRGMDQSKIKALETLVLNNFAPDLTFLFDAPAKVGLERVKGRGGHPDRFELEKIDFFERVRQVYLQRAQEYPARFCVVNANASLVEVQGNIRTRLKALNIK
jgi:dTMP kinase